MFSGSFADLLQPSLQEVSQAHFQITRMAFIDIIRA